MKHLRIAVADAVSSAEALAVALEREGGFRCVYSGPPSPRFVELVGVLGVDAAVVALDAAPDRAWLQALCSGKPGVAIIGLLGADDAGVAAEALRLGVRALVRRTDGVRDLRTAISGAVAGEAHIPPGLLAAALTRLVGHPVDTPEARAISRLTSREREILVLLSEGRSRREIATHLVLSPHTVRTHLVNLLRKLDAHSAVSAVALLRRAERAGGSG